ncbi:MAG: hypothetical protein LUM44_22365 [Pyrinomonadaceae bacterium]|nr:hypothetical protein [Pyrinomonadaceae bacterium]
MANKNKISIKPMNNAAAIASTLGIGASVESKEVEATSKISQTSDELPIIVNPGEISAESESRSQKDENTISLKRETTAVPPTSTREATQTLFNSFTTNVQSAEMPLLIAIKRKFPGKELYILSLLYLQRNIRGLVQMTVGNMMAAYSSIFQDVIKDDTARRSLKRLSDAGFIKTTSIPGNNSGYIYEIGDLLESELLSAEEREEFAELIEYVKSKLPGTPG